MINNNNCMVNLDLQLINNTMKSIVIRLNTLLIFSSEETKIIVFLSTPFSTNQIQKLLLMNNLKCMMRTCKY